MGTISNWNVRISELAQKDSTDICWIIKNVMNQPVQEEKSSTCIFLISDHFLSLKRSAPLFSACLPPKDKSVFFFISPLWNYCWWSLRALHSPLFSVQPLQISCKLFPSVIFFFCLFNPSHRQRERHGCSFPCAWISAICSGGFFRRHS